MFQITFSPALSREFRPYKPDPAPLLHICSSWEVQPNEVMMVGDSLKDDVSFSLNNLTFNRMFSIGSGPCVRCFTFHLLLSWSHCVLIFISKYMFFISFSILFRWPVGKEQELLHACSMKREGTMLRNFKIPNSSRITKCRLFPNFTLSWRRISTLVLDPYIDASQMKMLNTFV